MPMNLDYPGLNILHVDPPIFSIDDFLTREECEGIIQAAGGIPKSTLKCQTHTSWIAKSLVCLGWSLRHAKSF